MMPLTVPFGVVTLIGAACAETENAVAIAAAIAIFENLIIFNSDWLVTEPTELLKQSLGQFLLSCIGV
ncbi:MAG: hypothetical protein Q8R75_04345 [Methyloversatilis sp.]|nr:hypothetical protein [Methyloversatilis sp.]